MSQRSNARSRLGRRIGGLLAFLAAGVWLPTWQYLKEFIRAVFYERALHLLSLDPDDMLNFEHTLQYGVPIILVALGSWLFWRTGRALPTSETVGAPQALSASGPPAFKFVFGRGEPFNEIVRDIRFVRFGISNAGTGYLTNCHVFIKTISPNVDAWGLMPFRLSVDSFSLREGEPPKYFDLAYYHEPSSGRPGDRITIPICPPLGMMDRSVDLRPQRYVITLEETSTDVRAMQAICQMWIGPKGRLRLRQIS
jgi:hypothetical protein